MICVTWYLCPVKKVDPDNYNTISSAAMHAEWSSYSEWWSWLAEEWGLKLSLKDKATIRKYASEHGVASTVTKLKEQNLKESSVRIGKRVLTPSLCT